MIETLASTRGVRIDELLQDPCVKIALDRLLSVLEIEAQRQNIAVEAVEVRPYKSPEDGSQKIILRQTVDLPGPEAMRYWESLDEPVAEVFSTMPRDTVALLEDSVAIQIRR